MANIDVKKIDANIWQIPKTGQMKVPSIVYASERLMENIKQDKTLEQAIAMPVMAC